MSVLPSNDDLQKSIALGGKCDPARCWHKVAIAGVFIGWGEGNSRVRVDAGHVVANFRGWRYRADTPRHVKRSLMLFDRGLYDQLRCRSYSLRFQRTTRIVKPTAQRQEQINNARQARIKAGSDEARRPYHNLRKRVEGFSSIV
jgi:hypothetical protein